MLVLVVVVLVLAALLVAAVVFLLVLVVIVVLVVRAQQAARVMRRVKPVRADCLEGATAYLTASTVVAAGTDASSEQS